MKNTTVMYINSILSIERIVVKITLQSSKQEDLNDTISVRLKSHTKTDQIQGKFWKKWGVLNWSN